MDWKKVEKFGSRCSICGAHFEDDVCSNGHQLGEIVEVKTTKTSNYQDVKIKKKKDKKKTRKMRF